MPKKLRCDRCGLELTDIEDIYLVMDGCEAWYASVRSRGGEPRGVFPCENHRRCHGEMIVVHKWRARVKKLLGR